MISQTDKWVQFAFSHQTLIIEGIFAVILAIIVIWLFVNLNQENEKAPSDQSRGFNSDLEVTLKKLLENQKAPSVNTALGTQNTAVPSQNGLKTQPSSSAPVSIFGGAPILTQTPGPQSAPPQVFTAPTPVQTPEPVSKPAAKQDPASALQPAVKAPEVVTGSGVAAPLKAPSPLQGHDEELKKAKEELEGQKKRINDLLASLDQTRAELKKATEEPPRGDEAEELRNRIKTLEARLQEYEVIEDDIANLSIYKKENEELKRELNALRNGQGASASPTWPIHNEVPLMRPLKPIESKKAEVIAEEAGAKEGEKLLLEFQKFMKGSSNG